MTLLWGKGQGKNNVVMEIVENVDWEGLILVKGIPYNIFRFHQGFTTWNQLKDEEAN